MGERRAQSVRFTIRRDNPQAYALTKRVVRNLIASRVANYGYERVLQIKNRQEGGETDG